MLFEKQFFAFGHCVFNFRDGAALVDFRRGSRTLSRLSSLSGGRSGAGILLGEERRRQEQ